MRNRFFDCEGDVSTQLAPWEILKAGKPVNIALFKLRDGLRFLSDIAGGILTVPPNFISDLASIPSWAEAVFMRSDDPRIELISWFHDWAYMHQGRLYFYKADWKPTYGGGPVPLWPVQLTRKECDRMLAYEGMPELMAKPWQCHAVYIAVRLFGWRHWGK